LRESRRRREGGGGCGRKGVGVRGGGVEISTRW